MHIARILSVVTTIAVHFGFELNHFDYIQCKDDYTYETNFTFFDHVGFGFVHGDSNQIHLEYYLPKHYFVLFSPMDQMDYQQTQIKTNSRPHNQCSNCYFNTMKTKANLYPKCIDECFNSKTFVGAINLDNRWSVMGATFHNFHSTSQQSNRVKWRYLGDLAVLPHDEQYFHAQLQFPWPTRYGKWITPFMYNKSKQFDGDSALCLIVTGGYYKNNSVDFQMEQLSKVHCFNLQDIHVECDINASTTESLIYIQPCSLHNEDIEELQPDMLVMFVFMVGAICCWCNVCFYAWCKCCRRKVVDEKQLLKDDEQQRNDIIIELILTTMIENKMKVTESIYNEIENTQRYKVTLMVLAILIIITSINGFIYPALSMTYAIDASQKTYITIALNLCLIIVSILGYLAYKNVSDLKCTIAGKMYNWLLLDPHAYGGEELEYLEDDDSKCMIIDDEYNDNYKKQNRLVLVVFGVVVITFTFIAIMA